MFKSLHCFSLNECSAGVDDLAHATVTGRPAKTLGPAELEEIPKAGEVLPSHTTPNLDFGKEVGLLYVFILARWKLSFHKVPSDICCPSSCCVFPDIFIIPLEIN